MKELFGGNPLAIYAVYVIACTALIACTGFKENQRMFLLYLLTCACAFLGAFPISTAIILLLSVTFVFLEYLSEDTTKLALVTNIAYKLCDYIFMMFLQYHFFWILLAFALLHLSRYASGYQTLIKGLSLISLFLGAHLTVSQPFKIRTIGEICRVFEAYPPHKFEYKEEMQEKFELLSAFEDKTYFQRKNSYSCISFEYIKCFLKNHGFPSRRLFKRTISSVSTPQKLRRTGALLFSRGYSTPEMQLLRTVGILRGYDKYRIQRKIFEILYSKIIFASLKAYYKANRINTRLDLKYYRQYLLYVYFQVVATVINGKKCKPLSSAFIDPDDIGNWSMNGLFVACLGLSGRGVSDFQLSLFRDTIETYGLDTARIRELSARFPEKFPLGDM